MIIPLTSQQAVKNPINAVAEMCGTICSPYKAEPDNLGK